MLSVICTIYQPHSLLVCSLLHTDDSTLEVIGGLVYHVGGRRRRRRRHTSFAAAAAGLLLGGLLCRFDLGVGRRPDGLLLALGLGESIELGSLDGTHLLERVVVGLL